MVRLTKIIIIIIRCVIFNVSYVIFNLYKIVKLYELWIKVRFDASILMANQPLYISGYDELIKLI